MVIIVMLDFFLKSYILQSKRISKVSEVFVLCRVILEELEFNLEVGSA